MTLSGIWSSPKTLHYAWVVVAVTFAAAVVTAGVRATPGVLIVPLEEEFHWSRATISFALGINLLLFGAIGPFAAAVMDRFGARHTMTLALATTAASVLLTPAMSEPWQLILLWGVVVGLSSGFIGGYVAAYVAGHWFRAREGLPGNPVMAAFRALAIGARSRDFWLIAGGYFVCGVTTNGLIGTHLIAACRASPPALA